MNGENVENQAFFWYLFLPLLIPRGNVGTTKANKLEIIEPKVSSRINYWRH